MSQLLLGVIAGLFLVIVVVFAVALWASWKMERDMDRKR